MRPKEHVINLQQEGTKIIILPNVDPMWPYYNPAMAYDGDGNLRINIRSCNFTVGDEMAWHLTHGDRAITKNLYGYLDPETYDITDLKEIKYSKDSPEELHVTGLEDARIFWRKDGMHFSGTQVDTRKGFMKPAHIAEGVYNEKTGVLKYLRTLEKPDPNRVEKNWMSTDKPNNHFDFSYSPTQTWKDGKTIGDEYRGMLHGGSALLKQKDGTYLALLHSKHIHPEWGRGYNKYHYVNYFAQYNEQGLLTKISPSLTLNLGRIEFGGGMVEYGKYMLMSFGIKDENVVIARIEKTKLMDLLQPYNVNADRPHVVQRYG